MVAMVHARGALVGGAALAATIAAGAAIGSGNDQAPAARRFAVPAAAAALGVAALALGGRAGTAASLVRAGGAGLLIGAAGAALLGARAGGASAPSPAPQVAPAPESDPAPTSTNPAPAPGAPARDEPSPSPAPEVESPAPRPASFAPRLAASAPQPAAPEPAPEPAPAPHPMAAAAPVAEPSRAELLRVGSTGPAVTRLQARLSELHYAVNTDGRYTNVTRDAVMAFQKINGLDRDGVAGAETQDAMANPRQPELGPGKANRIDVDLSSQTLVVVRGGNVAYIVNATSGNPNHADGRGIATPTGTFSVDRKVAGTRHAPLGDLYYPSYFRGGVAVHGSGSIVAERASHGCVRIPRWIEQRVYGDMPMGTQVVVHG